MYRCALLWSGPGSCASHSLPVGVLYLLNYTAGSIRPPVRQSTTFSFLRAPA